MPEPSIDLPWIMLDLALILLSTKALGMFMRKIGLPQVVGALIAGILIGPAIWGQFGWAPISLTHAGERNFLNGIAELGVIMILFSAGLETDLKELKRSGLVSTLIASAGVIVPLGLGFLIAVPFIAQNGFSGLTSEEVLDCIFIGVILTATSVGITVETLKEMGKLKGKVGTCILSAAIIDDVIGIIVLTVVIGFKDPSVSPWRAIISTLLFFVFAIGAGVLINWLFRWLAKKYPNKRRIPIFSLVICFVYAFVAEEVFGIADITGAYLAGIMLSNIRETQYIDRKIDVNSYMIFSPVFFANIGLKTSFEGFTLNILWFALAFVAVGIIGKIIGCGAVARACKFSLRDSAKIGVGMIARGEVALIVTTKGIAASLLGEAYIAPVILLVIASSLLAPVILKVLYKKDKAEPKPPEQASIDEAVEELT